MSPSQWFRKAVELYYRLSVAPPDEQGRLLTEFEEAVNEVTVPKATPEVIIQSIREFNDCYTLKRVSGKSPDDSFNETRPTRGI